VIFHWLLASRSLGSMTNKFRRTVKPLKIKNFIAQGSPMIS
jgi:hypothetical protein